MEKITKFLKDKYLLVIVLLLMQSSISQCSSSKEISKLRKSNTETLDSLIRVIAVLQTSIDEVATEEEVEAFNIEMMYRFLVYEDDIDHGKMSISIMREAVKKDSE